MSSEREIVNYLRESRDIIESFDVKGIHYWRSNGNCWSCPSKYFSNPKDRSKYRKPLDYKEYRKLRYFSSHDNVLNSAPSIEKVPDYNSIDEVPEEASSDFKLFKSHIDRISNNITNRGNKGLRKETKSAFEYVSSMMCKYKCDYETLRDRYKNVNSRYHRIFQCIDSTIAHEYANDISKNLLSSK